MVLYWSSINLMYKPSTEIMYKANTMTVFMFCIGPVQFCTGPLQADRTGPQRGLRAKWYWTCTGLPYRPCTTWCIGPVPAQYNNVCWDGISLKDTPDTIQYLMFCTISYSITQILSINNFLPNFLRSTTCDSTCIEPKNKQYLES